MDSNSDSTPPRARTDPVVECSRCVRLPRDADDRDAWAVLEDEPVCPGCLTLTEAAARRTDDT